MAVALWKHTGRLFQFQSPLQVFHFTPQLSLRNKGPATQYQGLHKSQLQEETSVQQILQSFRTEALWRMLQQQYTMISSFSEWHYVLLILATFSTVLSPLCPHRVNQIWTYSACSSNPRCNLPLWQSGKILKTQNN